MLTFLDPRVVLINVARSTLWVREMNGANRGEMVDEIVRGTGLDPKGRYPWCAAWIAYIGRAALGRRGWPLKAYAGVVSLHDEAQRLGMLSPTPTRGAIFLTYGKAADGKWRYNHCGVLVDDLGDGRWRTIEGNTNEAGSPEGIGVFERTRTFGAKDRFIHWWNP